MIDQRLTGVTALLTAIVAEVAAPVPMVFGIPIGIVLAAHAGALFGLAHTPPQKWSRVFSLPPGQSPWRRRASLAWRIAGVLFTTSGNAFAVAAFVAVFPHLPAMGWAAKAPLGPGALVLAFGSQYLIIPAFQAGQRWIESRAPKRSGEEAP